MSANRDVVVELERLAEQYAANHRDNEAAVTCQLAGDYAFSNHPGVFASPALEETLEIIGRRLAGGQSSFRQVRTGPRRVLHVMTTASSIGGHSRLVQRWVQLDSSRMHSLAFTATRPFAPAGLKDAVWNTGGGIYQLGDVRRTLLDRAAGLRGLADEFDAVVLHTHPFDVVPGIAFAGLSDSNVALLNHADHVFWFGVQSSDRVINLRQAAAELNIKRRGIESAANVLLPIPLARNGRRMERSSAKRHLDLPPDSLLMVTMATELKYMPVDGDGFLDVVTPALSESDWNMIAVGPTPRGRWLQLESHTAGRLRAVGEQPDPSLFLDAADLYIDSFPFSSLTSLLEAGSRGTPLVAYAPSRPGAEVMGPDDPALSGQILTAADSAALARLLSSLASDADSRAEIGERQRQEIETVHTGPGWLHRCETMYEHLLGHNKTSNPDSREHGLGDIGLLDDLLIQLLFPVQLGDLAKGQCGYLGCRHLPLTAAPMQTLPGAVASSTDVGHAAVAAWLAEPVSAQRDGYRTQFGFIARLTRRVVLGRQGRLTQRRAQVLGIMQSAKRGLAKFIHRQ